MKVTIDRFGGEVPLLPALALPINRAQTADGCRFDEGYLRALSEDTLWDRAPMVKVGNIKAIYRYKPEAGDPASGYLFHWNQRTQVASGFIRGDSQRAVAFTTEGDFPRITDSSIATTGSDYPAASYRLGVPAPTSAPLVSAKAGGGLHISSDDFSVFTEYTTMEIDSVFNEREIIDSVASGSKILFLLKPVTGDVIELWRGTRTKTALTDMEKLSPPKDGSWKAIASASSYVVLAGDGDDGSGVAISSDNGGTWSLKATPGSRKWSAIAIVPQTTDSTLPAIIIAMSDDKAANPIIRSTNLGTAWTSIASPSASSWRSVAGVVARTNYGFRIPFIAVADDGDVITSNDGGVTWTTKSTIPEASNAKWFRVRGVEVTHNYDTPSVGGIANFFILSSGGAAVNALYTRASLSFSLTGVVNFTNFFSPGSGYDYASFVDVIPIPLSFEIVSSLLLVNSGNDVIIIGFDNELMGYKKIASLSNRAASGLLPVKYFNDSQTPLWNHIFHARMSGDEGDRTERKYLITYESDWTTQRFEGPPAQDNEGNLQLSNTESVLVGQNVLIEGLPIIESIPALPWKVTHVGIYRNSGTAWRRVGRVDAGVTTFLDNIAEDELGEVLASTDFYPPPSDMHHIGTLNNGIAFGVTDNEVAFSYPYLPHAWGPNNRLPFDSTVAAAVSLGALIYAFTKDNPFIITGQDPRSMYAEEIPVGYGCVSADSVCTVGDGVVYVSAVGLHLLRPGQPPTNIIEGLMTRQQWRELSPHSMLCGFYEGWLLVFWRNSPDKGCLVFRLDAPELGVVNLPDFDVSALYVDTALGALTYVKPFDDVENKAFIFQGGDVPDTAYKWRSGLLKPPRATTFTAVRVWSRNYDAPLTFRLFDENGTLLHSHDVTSERAFRLPGGQRSMAVAVELEGTQEVMRIEIANSMSELAT